MPQVNEISWTFMILFNLIIFMLIFLCISMIFYKNKMKKFSSLNYFEFKMLN